MVKSAAALCSVSQLSVQGCAPLARFILNRLIIFEDVVKVIVLLS